MLLEASALARLISDECGLPFDGRAVTGSKDRVIELFPAGVPLQHTFAIRTTVGWRSVEVAFIPGKYSADFVALMGEAGPGARGCCSAVLSKCVDDGATVTFRINGENKNPKDPPTWQSEWSRFDLLLRRGQLALGSDDSDNGQVAALTQQVAAAIVSLLPLEAEETLTENLQRGFPEGGKVQVQVNRYERDRRNRAAALAIHGYTCATCSSSLNNIYGAAAAGLIEVHHVTPVSKLREGYLINPATDLIPLCPNCHRMAHRRDPPFTPDEIRAMLLQN
jgi:5-methylcytosine-specific restriction enzyme A